MNMTKRNIVLIGMAGAGKSTLGVLAAKALGMSFVDTDIIIQETTERLLQEIIDNDGIDSFLKIEEDVLSGLTVKNSILATGGSAIYSDKGMQALKENGTVVYISVSYEEIKKRVNNIETRGIVLKQGNTLKDAFSERLPLYRKYADVIIECDGKDIEACVNEIVKIGNELS